MARKTGIEIWHMKRWQCLGCGAVYYTIEGDPIPMTCGRYACVKGSAMLIQMVKNDKAAKDRAETGGIAQTKELL